jgi:GTP-binding protein
VKFVDACDVDVVAGKGGNGSIAFRREKFVPFGGPAGGDGGRGGDIVFVADEGLSTLLDLTYGRTLRAKDGEQGHGKDCYGRGADDLIVRVPVGTQIKDRTTGELLFDIDRADARVIVAKGGKGGRGNIHFATPYDRAPRRAEPGGPGEERKLRLELKVMADVGLLGFPNVGKSTFIRSVSGARPKVADYPFTTLTPHLGVVRVGDEATMVIADIPGLIPGAADGAGLGHRFLKHVERTRALLHLVTLDFDEGRDPVKDYDALMTELERFDPELAKRPQIVAMTKADLSEVREAFEDVRGRFAERGIALYLVSAVTGEGVRDLSIALYKLVTGRSEIEDWSTPPSAPATEMQLEVAPEAEAEAAFEAEHAEVRGAEALGEEAVEPEREEPVAEELTAEEVVTPTPAKQKTAAKKAAPAKKRAAAKKAATKKKTAAKRKAAPAKKKVATKKKAVATKKAPPAKKKTATKKTAATAKNKAAAKKKTATKKKSGSKKKATAKKRSTKR